mgnify:CR=1 FL=1
MDREQLEKRYRIQVERMERDKKISKGLKNLEIEVKKRWESQGVYLRYEQFFKVLNSEEDLDFKKRTLEIISIIDKHVQEYKSNQLFNHAFDSVLRNTTEQWENWYELVADLVYHNSKPYFKTMIENSELDFNHDEFNNLVHDITCGFYLRLSKEKANSLLGGVDSHIEDSPLIIDVATYGRIINELELAHLLVKNTGLTQEQIAQIFIEFTKARINVTSKTKHSLKKAIFTPKGSDSAISCSKKFYRKFNLNL